jgi:hypothetical protein
MNILNIEKLVREHFKKQSNKINSLFDDPNIIKQLVLPANGAKEYIKGTFTLPLALFFDNNTSMYFGEIGLYLVSSNREMDHAIVKSEYHVCRTSHWDKKSYAMFLLK